MSVEEPITTQIEGSIEKPIDLYINGTARITKKIVGSAEKYQLTIVKSTYTRFLNLSPKITELEVDKFYIFNNLKTLTVGEGDEKLDLEGSVFQVEPGYVTFYKKRADQGVRVVFVAPYNVINIEIVMNDTFNKCNDLIYTRAQNVHVISYDESTKTFSLNGRSLETQGCYKFKNITQLCRRKEGYTGLGDGPVNLGEYEIDATAFIVWPRGIEFVRFDKDNNAITALYEKFWLPSITIKLVIYIDEEIINSLPVEIYLKEYTTTAKIKIKENDGENIEKGAIAFKQYKNGIARKVDIAEQRILNNKIYSFFQSKSTVKHGVNIITSFKVDDNNLVSLFNGGESPIGQFPMPVDFTVGPKPVEPKPKGGKRRTRRGRSKKSRKSIRRR